MRFLRLVRYYFEAFKAISRIILFLAKKCLNELICVFIAIIIIWYIFGFIVAFIAWIFGSLYIIYNFCDYLLYNPLDPVDSRTNVLSPMAFNLLFESNFITTEDNVTINVLLIKRPDNEFKSCPTFIYFHGNAGNIGHRLQNAYELYHEVCCNILLVEYRGYGLSSGQPSESGLYLDASAALHYLLQRPDIDHSKIVLFGRSLGGAVAIELARNAKLSPNIAAIIVENTFTSIPDIARTLFNCRFIRYLPNWYYKNQFNTIIKINSVTVPTLFISGLCDELVPASMMHTLYMMSASVNKQLHTFESGTHNFTWKCKNYYTIINLFLKEVIAQNSTTFDTMQSSTLHQHHHQVNHQSIIFENIRRDVIKNNITIDI